MIYFEIIFVTMAFPHTVYPQVVKAFLHHVDLLHSYEKDATDELKQLQRSLQSTLTRAVAEWLGRPVVVLNPSGLTVGEQLQRYSLVEDGEVVTSAEAVQRLQGKLGEITTLIESGEVPEPMQRTLKQERAWTEFYKAVNDGDQEAAGRWHNALSVASSDELDMAMDDSEPIVAVIRRGEELETFSSDKHTLLVTQLGAVFKRNFEARKDCLGLMESGLMDAVRPARRVPGLPCSCPGCVKPATLRCAKCGLVAYCTAKCQVAHWKGCGGQRSHKSVCTASQ